MESRLDQIGVNQQFDAYVSVPQKPNGHAVIVLQEIFGVTAHIRGIADRFAEDGYLAVAPDLFWRIERGVCLTHSTEDVARALSYLQRFDEDKSIDDIAATAAHIRGLRGFSGKVAAVGLCLGGKLAYLAAARTDLEAAVSFYGVGIENSLADAAQLQCPLLRHFGGLDKYVPASARERIDSALFGKAGVSYLYPDADHGFYTRGSTDTIALARERTNAFLEQAFGGSCVA
jgi:carboxymethylenebutenolidase